MTLITEPILGLEKLQREAFKIFFASLNDAVAQISDYMIPDDQELAALKGLTYQPFQVEPITNENFYVGHRPSLIDADITRYPNLSVWAVRTQPSPESAALDQMSISRTLLYIEVMVKASPVEGEEILNSRLVRTVEGVVLCVNSYPTLRGLVNGAEAEPTVSISEVFTRKERTAYGPHWFWQGARIEFTVRKESVAPTQTRAPGSIMRALRQPTSVVESDHSETGIPGVPGFDYSQYIDQG